MAATERMMGSLQQSSSALGSSPILSFKSFHPSYDFGRSCRKVIPLVQASMAGKEDQRSSTLSKSLHADSTSRSSSVSSLLKAFKDQDDEENPIQDDLNGGLVKEELAEEQVSSPGPRCAWPRLKLAIAEEERQEDVMQGPRCTWPRAAVQTQSPSSFAQQWKQEEKDSTLVGEGASGAKCSWPRTKSRNFYQNNINNIISLRSAIEGSFEEVGISKSLQEEGVVTTRSSQEDLQNGAIFNSTQEGLQKEALSQECSKEEAIHVNSSVSEGPRCAWPRSTPRRMLATGVGLSLMNYLLIGQGAPAFAIL